MEKSNGIKIAIIVSIAVGLAITPVCFGQKVLAGKNYELKGVGKGSISCSDGTKVKNARINFFVFYQGGGTYAEWNVDQKSLGSKGGIITKETVTSSKYNLKGVEAFDNICNSKVPAKMSLSGNCGEGSTVKLQAANGEKGVFKARAQCSAAQ
jgi:hypothetical protein